VTSSRRERPRNVPIARRAGAWAVWWAALMAFWIILDYSTEPDELLAGAGAAALGAFFAEFVTRRGGALLRVRARWLVPALGLPGQVARDTVIVFAALWRRLARGEEPASGFRELPARYGGESTADVTRRVLLIGGRSFAPNAFVLGMDRDRDVMVIHQLVVDEGEAAGD
jgi:hypothetical protein